MSRSAHWARAPITTLQLVYGNWRAAFNTGEEGFGAATTYRASIEYPAGVFTQVVFGGSPSGVAENLGEVISDPASVVIPMNAQFWVRTWTSNTVGVFYVSKPCDAAHGEAFEYSPTTTPDKTMSGTLTDNGAGIVTPYAIIGMSSRPAIWLAGDSRVWGNNDVYTGNRFSDLGTLARSIGPVLPYSSAGCPTESAQQAIAQSTRRVNLAKRFFTHVASGYGINDVNAYSRTAAQTYADLKTLADLFYPLPFFQGTLGPVTTSTDAWATTANQTVTASNPARVALNNLIREGTYFAGVMEIADAVETSRDSGIYKAPSYTADGLHELQKALAVVVSSNAINPGRFVA